MQYCLFEGNGPLLIIVKQSPQGKQIVAHGSGHFVFQDDPNLVINAINQLIHTNQLNG